ncbi:MAG: HD domain-containing protein [Chloroflexota bacterium]
MKLNPALINEFFRGFHIQRWNDRIRPMDLIEMDKHAHKMVIAYCLAKYEEARGSEIDWIELIRRGIYELLRRIIISDIKSPIYAEVKSRSDVFEKLNEYVLAEISPKIDDPELLADFTDFLFSEETPGKPTHDVLQAAHIYSSFWEFQIIKQSNPFSYQNTRIETDLLNRLDRYERLAGLPKLTHKHTISNFIDLYGQLRFQIRWAQSPRLPKTSVIGHSLFVAILAYFFVAQSGGCDRRKINAFFGGIFHDLPEAVTRDIISPVKRSSREFDNLITQLEEELAEEEIFPLLEPEWIPEIKYYSIDEFKNKAIDGDIIRTELAQDELGGKYNSDKYNPYDGKLIRAADQFSAFLEAWHSCSSGIRTDELSGAAMKIQELYAGQIIGGVDLGALYEMFSRC